jgi:hypothetical protein
VTLDPFQTTRSIPKSKFPLRAVARPRKGDRHSSGWRILHPMTTGLDTNIALREGLLL